MDKLTDEEMARLEGVKTEGEWNAACDAVKQARNGRYPIDWYPRVLATGLATRVLKRAGGSADISIGIVSRGGTVTPFATVEAEDGLPSKG